MSLVDHLHASRTPLELAKLVVATAKENAQLRDQVDALEHELFWTKVVMKNEDNNEAASAPKDGMQFYGKSITAEDVASFDELAQEVAAEAASASQSSTPVPRVGGNTSDELASWPAEIWLQHQFEYVPNFAVAYRTCSEITWCQDSIEPHDIKYVRSDLAHVARQRQESAAVAEGVDTATLPKPKFWSKDHPFEDLYTAEQMAQQREAGRRDMHETNVALVNENCALSEKVTMLERTLAVAQTALESRNAVDAALARQPASEGLTEDALTETILMFRRAGEDTPFAAETAQRCARVIFGKVQRALSAVPPAKAEGMSDTERNSARYLWLRDKSEPGICAFYLSVGKAFHEVKFKPETVDEAIDAQILAQQAKKGGAA